MLTRTRTIAVAALALTLLTASAVAQQASPWLHVEVRETGEKAETVNVNVPLSLARVALKVFEQKAFGQLQENLRQQEISIADIRAMWTELRNAGDAELVTVDSEKETVRVAREGERIRVRVENKQEGGEQVRVDVPVAVVDALLSGQGEELNLEAAIFELQQIRGDVVNVQEKNSVVRVWIDERS